MARGIEGWYEVTYNSGNVQNVHPKNKKHKEECKKDLDKMIELGNVKHYRWTTRQDLMKRRLS